MGAAQRGAAARLPEVQESILGSRAPRRRSGEGSEMIDPYLAMIVIYPLAAIAVIVLAELDHQRDLKKDKKP